MPRVLERARFEEIMEANCDGRWEGDNAYKGLTIIAKYFNDKANLIEGADHDIIYSVGVREILDSGITELDAVALRNFNWRIEDDGLACYV